MEWGTRAKLRNLCGSHDDDEENSVRRSKRVTRNTADLNGIGNETESDEEALHIKKKGNKRKSASAQVSTDDSGPDESFFESPATRARRNANEANEDEIKKCTVAEGTRGSRPSSEPVEIPKNTRSARYWKGKLSSQETQNLTMTTNLILNSVEGSADLRGEHDKDFQNLDDAVKQLSDFDDEDEDGEVVEMEIEEVEESVGYEGGDDEVEEVMSDEGEDDEDDEDVESEDLFEEEKDEIRRPRSRRYPCDDKQF
ncbi:hypothetical protein FGB62_204g11 [Gracilaria domingensis]|nr:hypothetical protein FGB62_204g11 [Gracilaria domingensis]